jgi:hypothetical protein
MKKIYRLCFKIIYSWLLLIFLPAACYCQDIRYPPKDGSDWVERTDSMWRTADKGNFFSNSAIVSKFYYGFLWAHRMGIEDLVTGHTTGFEITLLKQTDGSKLWQEVYGYPQTGFSYIHLDLANQYVGQADALVGFINFPLIRNPNFLFSFRLADGLGYVSTVFDRVENHKNLTVASHINAAIQMMADARFKISRNIFFDMSYGLTHFSNGSFKVPNLGINNISLNGGLAYQLNEPVVANYGAIPSLDRRWLLDLVYGFGVKENIEFLNKQFFAHTFYFSFLKPISYKSKLGVGGDVFYDLSLMQFWNDSNVSDISSKIIRGGAHVSYELQVNNFTVLLQMGVYLVDQLKLDGSFYHRIGLQYDLSKHLFANLTLKTHFARADYTELGLGWRIFLSNNEK